MAGRPDLWAPPVRKWMTEWHSPVRGMFEIKRTFRGSGPQHGPWPNPRSPMLDFSNQSQDFWDSQYAGIFL
jgi:hypothetical protein